MKDFVFAAALLGFAGVAHAQGIGVPQTGGNVPADFDRVKVGIVAHAGGGKAAATLLTGTINVVSTVATLADSLLLPPCTKAPQRVLVFNEGASNAQLFGSGTDTIDGAATGTGVALAAAGQAEYVCTTPSPGAVWLSK